MHYVESKNIVQEPGQYKGIKVCRSWILKEPFVFDFFTKNITRESRVLDVGCANGYFFDRLKESGYSNLFGVDMANYFTNSGYQHSVVDINVEKLPYDDNSFDVVTAFQTLEHLENYFLIEQEIKRVLKPGGWFILAVPNQFNIFYRIKFALTGNMVGWTLENNHLLFLTKDVFKKTYLKDFELVDKYYNKGPVPFFGRLNIIPGVKVKSRAKVLPRCEMLSDRVCYILKKR